MNRSTLVFWLVSAAVVVAALYWKAGQPRCNLLGDNPIEHIITHGDLDEIEDILYGRIRVSDVQYHSMEPDDRTQTDTEMSDAPIVGLFRGKNHEEVVSGIRRMFPLTEEQHRRFNRHLLLEEMACEARRVLAQVKPLDVEEPSFKRESVMDYLARIRLVDRQDANRDANVLVRDLRRLYQLFPLTKDQNTQFVGKRRLFEQLVEDERLRSDPVAQVLEILQEPANGQSQYVNDIPSN